MKLKTTYKEVKKNFPKQVSEVERNIRKGKSKHKEDNLDSFEWHYDWCTMVQSHSIQDMLNGKAAQKQQKWDSLAAREQALDTINRSSFTITASKGKGRWCSSILPHSPEAVEKHMVKHMQAMKDERTKFNQKSSAEKQQEVADAIKELSKYGGFAVLKVQKTD